MAFETEKSQFDFEKSQFETEKCRFDTEKSQFDTEKSQFDFEKSQFCPAKWCAVGRLCVDRLPKQRKYREYSLYNII